MTSKIDQVLEKVTDTQIKMARVEEHLKTLNGQVKTHAEEIEGNRKHMYRVDGKIGKIHRKISYFTGGLTAVIGFITFLGIKFRNYFS